MKQLLLQFRTIYSRYLHPQEGLYRKPAIRPAADWNIMILVFFVIMIGAIGMSVYTYVMIKQNEWWKLNTTTDSINQLTINTDALNATLADFTHRALVLKTLPTAQGTTTDPSL